jgi:hypothetical protein
VDKDGAENMNVSRSPGSVFSGHEGRALVGLEDINRRLGAMAILMMTTAIRGRRFYTHVSGGHRREGSEGVMGNRQRSAGRGVE